MSELQSANWSETAASNNAAAPDGWPEGLFSEIPGNWRRRQRQGVGNSPAQSENSMRNCFTAQSGFPRPLLKRHGFAVVVEPGVVAPVILLRFLTSPDAIIRAVGAIIIDTLDSKPFRAFAHILQKVLKTIKPTITDGNAKRTIAAEFFNRWIVAPLLHVDPSVMGRRSGFTVSQVCLHGAVNIPVKAPAGFRAARFQYASRDDSTVPARTAAKPSWNPRPVIVRAGKHRPAAKSLSGHILKFRHWVTSEVDCIAKLTMPENKSLVNTRRRAHSG